MLSQYFQTLSFLNQKYQDDQLLGNLHREFLQNGYVALPDFLDLNAFNALNQEILQIAEKRHHRDFIMEEFASPRRMSVLGGRDIKQLSQGLYDLYFNVGLRQFISQLVGHSVKDCSHPDEFMVVNFLAGESQTHGWHLDDPPYALIIVLDAPLADAGGLVEMISSWNAHAVGGACIASSVAQAEAKGSIQRRWHGAGDAYLLRADQILHRVTPLVGDVKRTAINMAFETHESRTYGVTASKLYGQGDR